MVREIKASICKADYNLSEEMSKKLMDRRSLFSARTINKGQIITKYDIKSVRLAYVLHTKYYKNIIGRKAKVNIDFAESLSLDMFEDE